MDNRVLNDTVTLSLVVAIITMVILHPADGIAGPLAIIGILLNLRHVDRSNVSTARVALGVNIAIIIAMLISKFWIVN